MTPSSTGVIACRELCRIIRHLGSGIKSIQAISPLFELALVLMRLDYVASGIVNANHGIMRTAEKLCVEGCVWLAVPQPTEWQRIGSQIDAATRRKSDQRRDDRVS